MSCTCWGTSGTAWIKRGLQGKSGQDATGLTDWLELGAAQSRGNRMGLDMDRLGGSAQASS